MHQRLLFCLKLDRELMLKEIEETEKEIIDNSLIANIEPTSEEIKKGFESINDKLRDRINRLKSKIEATEAKEKAFLEKLHGIEDPELREIAKAYFIDERSCEDIGKEYYLERTTVYKRLKKYFDK